MRREQGNVLFLILMAVVLFAALSYAITKSTRSGDANTSSEKAQLTASAIMNYNSAIRVAVMRMQISGIDPATIDFALPTDTGFSTPPFTRKVFHPQGGGVSYQPLPSDAYASLWDHMQNDFASLEWNRIAPYLSPMGTANAGVNGGGGPPIVVGASPLPGQPDISTVPNAEDTSRGRFFGTFTNYGWTPTAANDVVSTTTGLSKSVCEALNKKLTGNTSIPVVSNSKKYLVSAARTSIANANLTKNECAACENKQSLCVADSSTGPYNYYSILIER
jgi:hypothetical protein